MTAKRGFQQPENDALSQSLLEIESALPHPSDYAVPLLDAVLIEHGPAELLSRFFLQADAAIRDLGMKLAYSNDFSLLARINAANRESWYPLIPAFTAAGGAAARNAYFFVVYDAEEVVATQVGRVHDMPRGLTEHCRSLRLMYDDPSRALPGERCALTGDAAEAGQGIVGKVVFSGGTWCKPGKARGRGLASILARLSRAFALSRFGTDWTVSTVLKSMVPGGLVRAYGYQRLAFDFAWTSPASPGGVKTADNPVAIVWMSREELLSDLAGFLAAISPSNRAAE
jgi:hypothetical protein